ncbi:MAG: M50 family metallopeptidase [Candidatus Woesearchaeota archaeon]
MILGIFTLKEIIDAIIMSFVIGLIFSDYFARYNKKEARKTTIAMKGRNDISYDPIKEHSGKNRVHAGPLSFNWDDLKLAMICIAPAIILHELGHKFMAIGFGSVATFHISYMFLGIALFLKMVRSPFIFLVPAFVAFDPSGITAFQRAGIAIAGPAVNFTIFFICHMLLNSKRRFSEKTVLVLGLTKQINLLLGIFNMIPIVPFDGGRFFQALMQGISGL